MTKERIEVEAVLRLALEAWERGDGIKLGEILKEALMFLQDGSQPSGSVEHSAPHGEPKCNPHPKAPHGFNRNASHANDRYTCECEGWDAYDAGYQAGVLAGIEASIEKIEASIEKEPQRPSYVPEARRSDMTWVHATEWRGLTDEEISTIAFNSGDEESAIHAAMDLLKEKNQ